MPVTLDPLVRRAMLELWDQKCAWCRRRLLLLEMHVDHLNAETVDLPTVREVLDHYDLPADDFHIHDLTNLAPTHSYCNNNKSGEPLELNSKEIRWVLHTARRLKPDIKTLAKRYATHEEVAFAALTLLSAIERDVLKLGHWGMLTALQQMVSAGPGSAPEALGFGGRPHTRYAQVEYAGPTGGDTFKRDVWLVEPPDLPPVAVVVERDDDSGSSLMNVGPRIAAAVHRAYPAHTTVLHFIDPAGEGLRGWWNVVIKTAHGTCPSPAAHQFEQDHNLTETPLLALSLRSAGFAVDG